MKPRRNLLRQRRDRAAAGARDRVGRTATAYTDMRRECNAFPLRLKLWGTPSFSYNFIYIVLGILHKLIVILIILEAEPDPPTVLFHAFL